MTPEQIAEAVLATRFPTTHPGTAFYQNARTMIVDGIERALAQRPAEGWGEVTHDNGTVEWVHMDSYRLGWRDGMDESVSA